MEHIWGELTLENTRWVLILLDFVGVAVFAISGALVASRLQLDIIGFAFFALFTGVGGGTVRDVVIGATPFWVVEPVYVVVCLIAALVTYFTAPMMESRYKVILWADAVGIAAFAILGAAKTLSLGFSPLIAIIMGVMTATFGGIIRDVIAQEPSVMLRKELYITPTLLASGIYVLALQFGFDTTPAAIAGFVAGFVLRGCGIHFSWQLPSYRSRPGRPPEDIM